MDTTTIQITAEQKAQLDDRKQSKNESYKAVLQRLIDDHSPAPELTEHRVREIAREEINAMVHIKALDQ